MQTQPTNIHTTLQHTHTSRRSASTKACTQAHTQAHHHVLGDGVALKVVAVLRGRKHAVGEGLVAIERARRHLAAPHDGSVTKLRSTTVRPMVDGLWSWGRRRTPCLCLLLLLHLKLHVCVHHGARSMLSRVPKRNAGRQAGRQAGRPARTGRQAGADRHEQAHTRSWSTRTHLHGSCTQSTAAARPHARTHARTHARAHARAHPHSRTRMNRDICESRPATPCLAAGSGTSMVATAPLFFSSTRGLCRV